ncbi:Co2+/Mg2+ efflux protein ApaG [Flavobacteriaceae bacterium TK19130]|nr:Co2+/Mg2+ efflux protein ApaG [Thermobacterium salinum]
MVQKVTHGIKVSVQTRFEGTVRTNAQVGYAFSYTITIENQGKDTVQLISRYWKIKDALKKTETVEGKGVVGVQPVLKPDTHHVYSSGCLLQAPHGSMKGHYVMRNTLTEEEFRVAVPRFKLHAEFAVN